MLRPRLFLALFVFACVPALHAAVVADSPPPADPLGRDTPRTSVREFLFACHSSKFIRAAQFLDLSALKPSERITEGPELARHLCQFLDSDMDFEVEQLDNTPQGRSDDDLASDLELLATTLHSGHRVSVYLERQNLKGSLIWVVSADSVARIPSLKTTAERPALERYMPQPLIDSKLLGAPLWSWFGLVLLGVALTLLSRGLSRLAVFLLQPLARRFLPALGSFRMGTLVDPLRLLVGVGVFRVSMDEFAPSALLREYLLGALALFTVVGVASILMRVADVVSDQVITRLNIQQRALSYSVIPLSVRFLKICIVGIAVLVVLDQWNVRITTILAGVGVGGLAVALAAQKTIENLFGGISILTDRPVLVGDLCQFGTQSGTVTDIGLRSTRLRTSERTIVTIPNAQFSTMTLENLSKRDRMLFRPSLQLRRDTEPEKVRELMHAVEAMLRSRPDVDATDVPVRFLSIAPESFRLEVFSYILTTEYVESLKIQSELLLAILELAQSLKVRFAVPFAESLTVAIPEE